MADLKVPDNALTAADVNSEALTKAHLTILWAITLWYNGVGIQHGSQVLHLSHTKPPSLQTLLGCSDSEWENVYKPAFEDLKKEGGVAEKTILRRKVPWAPTGKLLDLTADLFADHLESIVVPHSAFNPSKGHIGDPLESLPHRTGVEQALSWLDDTGYQWKLYPGKAGHKRPDVGVWPLHSDATDGMLASHIEMISAHHNKQMYIKKYAMFTNLDRDSLWIFENRKAAADTINHLSETNLSRYMQDEYPSCRIDNTPLRNTENYSIQTLNRYLEQSREKPELTCTGLDYLQTITGIHQNRDIDYIRRPVTIWSTKTDEIELVGPLGQTTSITIDELNAGAQLRMDMLQSHL